MVKKISLLLVIMLGNFLVLKAQVVQTEEEKQPVTAEAEFVDDDLIIAALDSLNNLKYFENAENTFSQLKKNKYNFLPDFVPSYHDSVYYYRMQLLDVKSPISLTYNAYVKQFIELYAVKKRVLTSRVLGLAQIYFPLFEQQLDKYNIPLELKYLAIVESALNPEARSRVGASGLWQFMYYTGKVYGLEVTSYVDDRNDPVKSTIAACQHFKDLYNIYHDWLLVLAAYNSGPGNVNKAIRRSGGKMNFWEIRQYLPRETRDYVPAFIAVNYVMNYSNEHNLYPVVPRIIFHETDTVGVTQPLAFSVISEKLKIQPEELSFLNPTFRKGYIPATPTNPYYIRLPLKSVADFVNNAEALYAANKLKGYSPELASNDNDNYEVITKKITHKVRRGENITSIARRYGCTTQEIKKWNKLKKSSVYKGQVLKLYVETRRPLPPAKPANNDGLNEATASNATTNDSVVTPEIKHAVAVKNVPVSKPRYHIVKKGEYLSKIADKYNVSLADLKNWNHLKSTKLIAGQKLRVNNPELSSKEALAKAELPKDTVAGNAAPDTTPKLNGNFTYYTVRAGDTLWSIAQKYDGVTINQIREWNNLKREDNIKVGQKLKVIVP